VEGCAKSSQLDTPHSPELPAVAHARPLVVPLLPERNLAHVAGAQGIVVGSMALDRI